MRIKLYLLAFAAALAMNVPAQAGAVFGFAQGNAQGTVITPGSTAVANPDPNTPGSDPGNPAATDPLDPYASIGVNDLTAGTLQLGSTNGGTIGQSPGTPWVLQPNTKYVLQIQMVDSGTFTFVAAGNARMSLWGARLSWNATPGVVTAQTEQVDGSNNVVTALRLGANSGSGLLNAVLNSYNNQWTTIDGPGGQPTPNSLAIGEQTLGAGTGFTVPAGASHKYVLANVIITTGASGDADLSIVDPRPTGNDVQQFNGTTVDSAVFATVPHLFIHINAVPEPSSMALAGLAVSGLVYRFRRKKAATVVA